MEQPAWLATAWAELGQREVAGAADNARIRAFFRDVGQPPSLHDEVAWCAAFAGACLERAGHASTRSLMARSYLRWGAALDEGRFGAVAVLEPRQRSGGRTRRLPARRNGRARRAARRQPGRCGGRRRVSEDAAARVSLAAGAAGVAAGPGAAGGASTIRYSRPRSTHVLEMEGGFTDDPHDPGGPTNRGITLKVFAAWKGVRLDRGVERGAAGGAAAHRARYRARHLFRALLDAGALRRAQPGARLLPLRCGGQSRRHRRHAAAAARRRHRRRRRDRPQHARAPSPRFPSARCCSATPRCAAPAIARCTTSGASAAGGWRASTRRSRVQPR